MLTASASAPVASAIPGPTTRCSPTPLRGPKPGGCFQPRLIPSLISFHKAAAARLSVSVGPPPSLERQLNAVWAAAGTPVAHARRAGRVRAPVVRAARRAERVRAPVVRAARRAGRVPQPISAGRRPTRKPLPANADRPPVVPPSPVPAESRSLPVVPPSPVPNEAQATPVACQSPAQHAL
jgi:hypothetical protein